MDRALGICRNGHVENENRFVTPGPDRCPHHLCGNNHAAGRRSTDYQISALQRRRQPLIGDRVSLERMGCRCSAGLCRPGHGDMTKPMAFEMFEHQHAHFAWAKQQGRDIVEIAK